MKLNRKIENFQVSKNALPSIISFCESVLLGPKRSMMTSREEEHHFDSFHTYIRAKIDITISSFLFFLLI